MKIIIELESLEEFNKLKTFEFIDTKVDINKLSLDDLFPSVDGIYTRIINVFKVNEINTLECLLNCTERDLLIQPNFSRHSLNVVINKLSKHNLKLKKLE